MEKLSFIVIVILVCTASYAASGGRYPDAVKGFQLKSLMYEGRPTNYSIYVPPTYDPAKPTPTIVYMHGAGECGTDGIKPTKLGVGVAVAKDPAAWPFIVVFPQLYAASTTWIANDALVMKILDKTRRELNVDRSRIYLTGASKGGNGTWAIAASHPDLFAAIAPVCGGAADEYAAKRVAKLPIWLFHGEKDTAVPIAKARKSIEWVTAAGGSVKASIYPDLGHGVWDRAYQDEKLNEWFLEQKKR